MLIVHSAKASSWPWRLEAPRLTLFKLGFFMNPYRLGAVVLSALLQVRIEWLDVRVLALVPAAAIEITKWVRGLAARRPGKRPHARPAPR